MTEQAPQLEVALAYQSRREVLMSVIALNHALVQYHLEEAFSAAPWGLGPLVLMGVKRTYGISRKELWRLPIRLLSDLTDEAFDKTYDVFFPFIRDL